MVDTGGWYKLCCPTSQLHKPDVLGAIYRVRRDGMRRSSARSRGDVELGLGRSLTPDATGRAARRSPAGRAAAGDRDPREPAGEPAAGRAASAICTPKQPPRRRHGRIDCVWTACADRRSRRARALVARGAGRSPTRRSARRRSIPSASGATARRSRRCSAHLRDRRSARRPPRRGRGPRADRRHVRRARPARGRRPSRRSHPGTLAHLCLDRDRRPASDGRAVESTTRNPTRRDGGARPDGRRRPRPEVRRGPADLGRPGLKETASWIVGRHPEWAGELAGVLGERLARIDLSAADRAELERQLGRVRRGGADPAAPGRSPARSVARRPRERLSCLQAMAGRA